MEEVLDKIDAGLNEKYTVKKYSTIVERIGRLLEKNRRVGQDYHIEVIADDEKKNPIQIKWQRQPRSEQKDHHCGVYCLRTNTPTGQKNSYGQPM